MGYPHRKRERSLYRKGARLIAGLDEAGRGAWAGPIVAAAVILPPKLRLKGVRDSKLLRAPIRRQLYEQITAAAFGWAVGVVSEQYIDQHGLQAANLHAMTKALHELEPQPDYLLIDALELEGIGIPQEAIIDGDYKIFSIAAASIVAKVTRDTIMEKLSLEYPAYGFSSHKGYGTNHHYQMLVEHGACPIHRRSFEPVKFFLTAQK